MRPGVCNTAITPSGRQVREQRKARRLRRLVEALPRIRRAVNKHLATAEPTREFALAAVIELVSCSAIRAGQRELREVEPRARRRDACSNPISR